MNVGSAGVYKPWKYFPCSESSVLRFKTSEIDCIMVHKSEDCRFFFGGGLNNRYNKFHFCPLCTFIMLDKISNIYLKKCSNRQTFITTPMSHTRSAITTLINIREFCLKLKLTENFLHAKESATLREMYVAPHYAHRLFCFF